MKHLKKIKICGTINKIHFGEEKMKLTVRIISLLISIVMLVSQLSACGRIYDYFIDVTTDILIENDDDGNYVFEVVYPEVSVSTLSFSLGEEHLREYNEKLVVAKMIFEQNKSENADKFRDVLYELMSLEAYIRTQCDIAYLQYYYDTSDATAWGNYLYAYDLYDIAHDLFWSFYSQSKAKNTELARVFCEVIENEYQGHILSVTTDSDRYAYEMEVLEGEYNALVSKNASDAEIFEVYKEYMIAAHGYATSAYTDNYYEYASKYMYLRDDTAEQRAALRAYTKQYLVPLLGELIEKTKAYDAKLTKNEYNLAGRYLTDSYDTFGVNYLGKYFKSLPDASGKAMQSAFDDDRVLIGDKKNSYMTAMVYTVGDTPICYFHEDFTTLNTMAHELGHYYARVANGDAYFSYSLKETHSTANEMLLYSFLSKESGSRAFRSAELYMLANWVYQVVLSVIKDDFDERIYGRDPSALELSDFNNIINTLIDEYGISDMAESVEDHLTSYWSTQGINYPVSNYCYAIAFTASLQIYLISKEDYSAATAIYTQIVEESENSEDFVSATEKAGLLSPYDEQTYITLLKLADI